MEDILVPLSEEHLLVFVCTVKKLGSYFVKGY